MTNHKLQFGHQDHSYQAAGEYDGLKQLVDDFYDAMDTLTTAKKIRDMHPRDLTVSRDKLTLFLSAWLGGPRNYSAKYGAISIPQVHSHLDVGESEKQAWLDCMSHAIEKQDYSAEFGEYLITQLATPANRIQAVCKHAQT